MRVTKRDGKLYLQAIYRETAAGKMAEQQQHERYSVRRLHRLSAFFHARQDAHFSARE